MICQEKEKPPAPMPNLRTPRREALIASPPIGGNADIRTAIFRMMCGE